MTKIFDNSGRKKRGKRIRFNISKKSSRPRMSVFRSNNHIYAQIIDDSKHVTCASASTLVDTSDKSQTKMDSAKTVGSLIAEKALKIGIKDVVFDRGGFAYHGRIKALAESAREKGLKF